MLILGDDSNSGLQNTYTQNDWQWIKDINTHFDLYRPLDLAYPPLLIDWTDPQIELLTDRYAGNLNKYLDSAAFAIYDEDAFKPETYETYKNVLPDSTKGMPNINSWKFPEDPEAIFYSRMRFVIAPNTKVSFSNGQIFETLGFTEEQIGKRGAQNRYHIVNPNNKRMEIVAQNPPLTDFKIDRDSKIYISKMKMI